MATRVTKTEAVNARVSLVIPLTTNTRVKYNKLWHIVIIQYAKQIGIWNSACLCIHTQMCLDSGIDSDGSISPETLYW